MHFAVIRTSRWPRIPRWVLAVVLVWLALLGLAVAVSHAHGTPAQLCWFKRATGLPCPTCGTTRALEALASGRLLDALAVNPLVMVLLSAMALVLAVRVMTRRALTVRLSAPLRRGALWAALAIVALNWVYLIVRGT
jgi:hypothetical protein